MSDIGVDISPREVRSIMTKPQISTIGKLAFPLTLILAGLILVGLFVSILKINYGTFIYSMDDPYIGLALSDQVRHGNYGINAGLHSAPCSSILPPLLLSAASGTWIHPYFPLLLNTLATFVTLTLMWRFLTHLRFAQDTFGWVAQAIAVFLMALCFNLFGVVFTGLEHSLHIAVTVACIYGLALFLDRGKLPVWLPAIIVLDPLMRYEGLALSVGAIVVLAMRGRWRTAGGAFAMIVLLLGSFSAFLISMKLPALPNSIITKSNVVAKGVGGGGFLESVGWNLVGNLYYLLGFLLLVSAAAAAIRCYKEIRANGLRWTSQGLMALALMCLAGGHVVMGKFGGLDRYEDYVLLGTTLMWIYLKQEEIRHALSNRKDRLLTCMAAGFALLALCPRYLISTWQVPVASNNIYEQQFQMHRFINDFYRGPVAVNDLGLTSYHNPNLVLDLAGLGSEEARVLLATNANADAYREIVDRNGVHLVIIFDEWFRHKIPASWIKVASMDQSRKCVSCAESEVQFYAADAATAVTLREELRAFTKVLPPRVKLFIYDSQAEADDRAAKL